MSRYYLIASLPTLSLEQPPQITAEAFLLSCREQLGRAEAEAAEALMTGAGSAHPFVSAWREKDTLLRNAVAKARARAAGADASRWLRHAQGCDAQVERLAEDAMQQPDPAKQERALDKARWVAVEGLQGLDPMGANVPLAYAVKLALALRWAALDAGRGQEAFDGLTRLPEGLVTL
ncbi:MAG: hypothetical protein FWG50_11925 [Kiritimatiellaeota bacterium]|nr:hypothetical protein [Kiritimatiellota bacterium]